MPAGLALVLGLSAFLPIPFKTTLIGLFAMAL